MQLVLSLVPVLLIVAMFAAYVKLAARLLRRTQLRWAHAFAYAILLSALAIAGRAVALAAGQALPVGVALCLGLATHFVLGSWFFSTRARTAEGHSSRTRLALSVMVSG